MKKSGTNDWLVMKPFVWFLDYNNRKGKIEVPLGFITDFGSIPQLLWIFFNPTKFVSYILHDYLYSNPGLLTRKECDIILIEALKIEGMGLLKRILIYLAVRLFGRRYFKNN
ncbi:DUF1353 domain-containing protein [Candidatus Gracilibacteria bacterium]|nr:MAG: DUF1353 domain-containing protein [Candidatus Gracilibacteria bacterium]